jgi:uncharacterized membrane protein YuzA (DUF378 family)
MKKGPLDLLAMILLIVGGLNWGLFGLFNLDLVQLIFGSIEILAKVIYVLVGLSAVYGIYMMTKSE